jgi:putative membrane protein
MVYPCGGSFYFFKWQWMVIPWVPVALIGTAEAFYVGFKNNQAMTDYGKQEKYGVVLSTPAVLLPPCFMLLILQTKDLELEKKRKN